MKRSALPARSKPLAPGKPLPRGKALRRAAIVRTRSLARSVRPSVRKAKTRVGEFPQKTRKLMFNRWGGRCCVCGDFLPPKWWTAQHRRARGNGGSSDPLTGHVANGIAVHEIPCHRRIESLRDEAKDNGWRVPFGTDPRTVSLVIWTGERVFLTDEGGWRPVAAEPEES